MTSLSQRARHLFTHSLTHSLTRARTHTHILSLSLLFISGTFCFSSSSSRSRRCRPWKIDSLLRERTARVTISRRMREIYILRNIHLLTMYTRVPGSTCPSEICSRHGFTVSNSGRKGNVGSEPFNWTNHASAGRLIRFDCFESNVYISHHPCALSISSRRFRICRRTESWKSRECYFTT